MAVVQRKLPAHFGALFCAVKWLVAGPSFHDAPKTKNNEEKRNMLQEIWQTIVSEFSDLPDVQTVTRITLRILMAAILGGLLGYERERKAISAGVRTHMLVAVGAAIFMIGPTQAGMTLGDLARVIQGTIQGIGFPGAGAIIVGTATQNVQGLTTAASIWAAAGIGVAAGLGVESTAVLSTVVALIILAVVPLFVK